LAEIIDLSNIREYKIRKLERIFEEEMKHPSEKVLKIWKKLAKESVRKYPGAPSPTAKELNFKLPASVTQQEANKISETISGFIINYQNDVQKVMMQMLEEIIILQKEVAEKRAKET
jgi:hypothetical protein